MTIKTPIRLVLDGSNNPTGLAEFQTGEIIGVSFGGTGNSTLTSNAILLGNGTSAVQSSSLQISGSTLSSSDSSIITIDDGLNISGALSVTGNTTITGNLTVNGTTTTINSTTIDLGNQFRFEGSTANDYETTLTAIDPTDDRTISLPNVSGNIITTGNISDINNLSNSQLINSSITISDDTSSTTTISLGETLKISGGTGLNSTISGDTINLEIDSTVVTETGNYTLTNKTINGNDNIITHINNNSLDHSSIKFTDDTSTVANVSLGDTLKISAGSGIDTTISGNTLTISLESTVVTETSSDTLTNKSINLTNNTITGTLSEFNTALSDANFASVDGSETLTNKTISGSSNTLTDISNSSLTNSSITLVDDSSSTTTVSLGESLKIAGGSGVDTTITGDTVTISLENTVVTETSSDTLTNKSISLTNNTITGTLAEFNTALSDANFTSIDGVETLTNKSISGSSNTLTNIGNSSLTNSSITIGSTSTALGATSTALAGLTQLTVDNVDINGNTISSTDTNGNLTLSPNGQGVVKVPSGYASRSNVDENTLITKGYADAIQQSLNIHAAVKAATTDTLANLTSGTVTYDNGTGGVTATLTLQNALTTLDNYTLLNGDRILIKNQANQAHNGIYTWATGGTVLTRATDFDSNTEIAPGDFVFVVNGTINGNNGYAQTSTITTVGSDNIVFTQFSGAGQIVAGDGLSKSDNTLNVNADNSTIEIHTDSLRVKDSGITNAKLLYSGITIVDDTSSTSTINLGQSLKIAGGTGLISSISGDTLTISTNSIPNSSLTNSSITLVDDSSSTTTLSLGESLMISGDTGITTTISGDRINIDLDDTTVNPGSYGSSTSVPVLNIDQQGRITSASTASISTTLRIVDDSSTLASIDLANDTLKISGTTNEIETIISGDTVQIGLPTNVTISGDFTANGNISLGVDDALDTSTIQTLAVNARITTNLIPNQTLTYDLGSAERRWRDIYLSGNTIDLNGATISGDGTGAITISATGAVLPTGSQVGNQNIATADPTTGIATRFVPLYTVSTGLTTPAVQLTFRSGSESTLIFQDFTLSTGANVVSNNTQGTIFAF
jgi:trimeric autotransporter adhesin